MITFTEEQTEYMLEWLNNELANIESYEADILEEEHDAEMASEEAKTIMMLKAIIKKLEE